MKSSKKSCTSARKAPVKAILLTIACVAVMTLGLSAGVGYIVGMGDLGIIEFLMSNCFVASAILCLVLMNGYDYQQPSEVLEVVFDDNDDILIYRKSEGVLETEEQLVKRLLNHLHFIAVTSSTCGFFALIAWIVKIV